MDAKILGNFIAELRKENKMTQAELAEKLNVTDKAVSRWERGVGLPDVNTIEPIAEMLGVSIAEIVKGRRLSVEEVMQVNDSECIQELIKDIKKDTSTRVWSYALLAIIILIVSFYLQYGHRDLNEIYGGSFEIMIFGAVAMILPWFSLKAKKYQPLFIMGSYFCVLLAMLSEAHFMNHKAYINDVSALLDTAGVMEFIIRYLGGAVFLLNLVIYVLLNREHHKILAQFFVDMKDGIYKRIMWLMSKF